MKEAKNTATIECDLLEELIDIAQDWVYQNAWRRGATLRDKKMVDDADMVISEARKYLW